MALTQEQIDVVQQGILDDFNKPRRVATAAGEIEMQPIPDRVNALERFVALAPALAGTPSRGWKPIAITNLRGPV